jgi:hypothetical protein
VLLVDPRAGTRVDTADFLLHTNGSLLGFTGRPKAASWRERHRMAAAFMVVRSRESMDRLALTAIIRCDRVTMVLDPFYLRDGTSGVTDTFDFRDWLRYRLPISPTLYEFARVRGWQSQMDALLAQTSDLSQKD